MADFRSCPQCGAQVATWRTQCTECGFTLVVTEKRTVAVAQYASKAFTDDFRNLMDLAFQAGLDFDRFTQALRMSNPAAYDLASARLDRLVG